MLMTIKTDFRKIESFIKQAEALPKEQGNLSRDYFLSRINQSDELLDEVMRFIWYNKILERSDKYDHLKDSKELSYKDRIDILLEVLYKSRDELISIDPSLANQVVITRSKPNYLIQVTSVPDEFYKKLIDEINILYGNDRYIPVCLLLRKLFENLIIDILRKKYGMTQIILFYNPSKSMFQSFSTLLDNLKTKIDDFKPIEPSFDQEIIKRIDYYRERGNSSAHSISADITKKDIDDKKDEINYLIMLLIRILNNI